MEVWSVFPSMAFDENRKQECRLDQSHGMGRSFFRFIFLKILFFSGLHPESKIKLRIKNKLKILFDLCVIRKKFSRLTLVEFLSK
jgi:hypothetical protein